MKKLPTFVKWLLVAAALAAMAGMMWLVNDRAARVAVSYTHLTLPTKA